MTQKFLKFFSLSALLLGTCFTSCDKEENDKNDPVICPVNTDAVKIFILNEGLYGQNNSKLDIYYPNGEKSYQSDVYAAQNGEGLGDTGQDIISCGGRLYMSVFGSNYLAKLDSTGKVIEKHLFTEEEGQPRFLATDGGYIYVSLYSGKVAKFDTASIAEAKSFVEVGPHPEKICIEGNTLYAAIAGDSNVKYDNRIAVIDLSNFSLKEHIEVAEDPTDIVAINNTLYVLHYNTTTWAQEILEVNPKTKNYTVFATGSKFATDGVDFYYINSTTTDWVNYTTEFYKKGSTEAFLDFTSTPELKTSTVYLFNIDTVNGDFYIGTTDYKTNGTIYRFDKDGKLLDKFETSSISPSKAVVF